MNAILWVLQVLLAAAFFAHGMLFLTPPASMVEQMAVLPRWFQLFLGTAEVLGAVGLTLPGITRIMPDRSRPPLPAWRSSSCARRSGTSRAGNSVPRSLPPSWPCSWRGWDTCGGR